MKGPSETRIVLGMSSMERLAKLRNLLKVHLSRLEVVAAHAQRWVTDFSKLQKEHSVFSFFPPSQPMTDDDWELHKSYATGRWFEAAPKAVLEDMATLHVDVYKQQFLHELCIYSPQIFVDDV